MNKNWLKSVMNLECILYKSEGTMAEIKAIRSTDLRANFSSHYNFVANTENIVMVTALHGKSVTMIDTEYFNKLKKAYETLEKKAQKSD